MKKLLCIVVLWLAFLSGSAATYYVSSSSGSDGNSGTSILLPWSTLGKVQSSMSSFAPGDFILFKRGDKFRDSLDINKSGNSSNYITFGAYGAGDNPLFWGKGGRIISLFYMYNRSYIIIRDITVSDTTISVSDSTNQSRT